MKNSSDCSKKGNFEGDEHLWGEGVTYLKKRLRY